MMDTCNMKQMACTYVSQYFLFCKCKQVTNILPCNLFNTCILTLYLHTSNVIGHYYFAEDGHCMPKHVGECYIF